jgi:hypothetical protein
LNLAPIGVPSALMFKNAAVLAVVVMKALAFRRAAA